LRGRLLRSFAQDSRAALVWVAEGKVAGWGLLRPGERADYLGPMTCANTVGAGMLAGDLLRAAEGRAVFWDIPDGNGAARGLAEGFGFEPVRPLIRMRLGPEVAGSSREGQYAIADPAVG
jgi:hypothetical protein